ncbi:MAG: molecular chaperone HtpG, partial [Bacteroidales bacterium]|nr:molecular chaperone HtpG [Bacteroidales bacterium]
IITQSEFMRRMKDMSQLGGGMNFYGDLPDSYNLVINNNHSVVSGISEQLEKDMGKTLKEHKAKIDRARGEVEAEEKSQEGKKDEEITQAEKDKLEKIRKSLLKYETAHKSGLTAYAEKQPLVKQLIDLAMLSNNMLKGEKLTNFVKRSIDLL